MVWSLLVACTDPGAAAAALSTVVKEVRVEPAELDLEIHDGEPAEADFTAIATFEDGSEGPLDLVAWSSTSASTGTIDQEGHFVSASTNGGKTEIVASHVGITGTSAVRVVLTDEIFEDVDEGFAEEFAAVEDEVEDDEDLAWLYPADGVTVPRNIAGMVLGWAADDDEMTMLRLRSEITDVSVYVEGGEWTPSADLWTAIAATNRTGSVTVQATVGEWDDGELSNLRRGPELDITVNRFDARGSVLYWSTGKQAIMRTLIGETATNRFFPVLEDESLCVGCHTLSEAQQKLVVTRNGNSQTFAVIDISDPDEPENESGFDPDKKITFSALSPDGQYMIGVNDGELVLREFPSTDKIETVDTDGYKVTHPAWSPDGESILYVRQTNVRRNDMAFDGGEIVQVPWDGQNFGEPDVLVERDDTWNNYYPAYSPDGEWIAFNRSSGSDPSGEDDDSYADPNAELWLVSRDGSTMVRLDAANGQGASQNSFPRWGPLSDSDVLWLAYSSVRDYAIEDRGQPQIWISAIQPDLIAEGEDPSSPPFWMPGQSTGDDNHLPVWWSQ